MHELSPRTVAERIAARQTILPTADVELGELFTDIERLVGKLQPRRAVIDSVSVLRLLAGSSQRYHREVVTLRQLFSERGCTLLVLDDFAGEIDKTYPPTVDFQPLSGCLIQLEQDPRVFGDVRRHIRVVKARGLAHNGGIHDCKIRKGGMDVYPRLGAYSRPEYTEFRLLSSGVESLDAMLGGGLEKGTACLIVGPSGAGKSTVATFYVDAVARDGQRAAVFLFDERPETFKSRSEAFGLSMQSHIDAGLVTVQQLDPGEVAPGEFAQMVRDAVERRGVQVIVIDSITGYFNAMGSSELLVAQLHELLTFLSRSGVLTLIPSSQHGLTSIGPQEGPDVSYLSDAIIVLGFFEVPGELRRYISAAKKRNGRHDSSIRELLFERGQVRLGEPLRQYRKILLDNAVPAARFEGDGDG